MIRSFTSVATSIWMFRFRSICAFSSPTSISTISSRWSFVSGWKTTISSIRFRNSGLNERFSSEMTLSFILPYWLPALSVRNPRDVSLSIIRAPRFEVMMMTVFLKSTLRPTLSVRYPSSSTWSSMLKMSGWAFSISSKSTTE